MQSVKVKNNNIFNSNYNWVLFNFIKINIELGRKEYRTHYKREGKLAAC